MVKFIRAFRTSKAFRKKDELYVLLNTDCIVYVEVTKKGDEVYIHTNMPRWENSFYANIEDIQEFINTMIL